MQGWVFCLLHDGATSRETGRHLAHCWAKHQNIWHAAFIVDQHQNALQQCLSECPSGSIIPGVSTVNRRWRGATGTWVIVGGDPGPNASKLRCQGIVARHLCLVGQKGCLNVTTKLTRPLHFHLVNKLVGASCRVYCTKAGTHASMLVR